MRRRDVLTGGLALTGFGATSAFANTRPEPIKLVIVGDSAVGKTCALISYATNAFPRRYVPTVMDNMRVNTVVDAKPALLSLWDTAGGAGYNRLRPLSYPQTDVFILAYSVASPSSFDNISSTWLPEIRHHAQHAPVLLAGLKTDLRTSSSGPAAISPSRDLQKARRLGLAYGECSALTQQGLKRLFDAAVRLARGPQPSRFLKTPVRPKPVLPGNWAIPKNRVIPVPQPRK